MRRAPLFAAIGCAASLAIVPAHAGGGATKTVGFSILEDYDSGEPLSDVVRDFDLFRELGITTWRGSFAWDHYEPRRGQFDFGWLENDGDVALSPTEGGAADVYRHLFVRDDGHQLLFLWDKVTAVTVDVRLPHRGTQAIEDAIDGSSAPCRVFDGSTLTGVRLAPSGVRMFEVLP